MAAEVKRYPEGEPLPEGVCPGCRSARPVGRIFCQACTVSFTTDPGDLASAADQLRELGYPDLARAVSPAGWLRGIRVEIPGTWGPVDAIDLGPDDVSRETEGGQ